MSIFKTTVISKPRMEIGIKPAELLAEIGMATSRKEAKHFIRAGAFYCGGDKINDINRLITIKDMGAGGQLLRIGKRIQQIVLEN